MINDPRRFSPIFAAVLIVCVCVGTFVKQPPFLVIGWIGVIVVGVLWIVAILLSYR